MEISVILPVYNVYIYIERCIRSILEQSFRDFELIVIDDCGSDSSIDICKTLLEESDITYKIIYNEKNEGLSESRNIGVRNSISNFILFIDSDDWLDPLMLEKLFNAAVYHNADVVSCKATRYWEDSNSFTEITNIERGVYNSQSYLNSFFNNETNVEVWARLIKREIFDQIYFPAKVPFEDILTVPYIIQKSEKIVHLDDPLYFFVKRSANTSLTGMRPSNIKGFLHHLRLVKTSFESEPSKLESRKFVYRNLLNTSYSLIQFSNKYLEVKPELELMEAFIKLKEIITLHKKLSPKHISFLYLLKFNKYLFYVGYKAINTVKSSRYMNLFLISFKKPQ